MFAQKEANIWYFAGGGAGIDFNSCTPVVLTNGWLDSDQPDEGAASMCNEDGELLFYTAGKYVINANHVPMLNGNSLGPIASTMTQNLIVKKPGSNNIYYIISPEIQAMGLLGNPSASIIYSEVDMSLDGGLGEVISYGNILKDTVSARSCEKLTAVRHANGTDIWVIAHELGNNNFLAYLVTSAGININSVISSTGPVITGVQGSVNTLGELKASPDGRKLAFTTGQTGTTALFNFDNNTGVISAPIPLILYNGNVFAYGVSFSPDNKKLYISFQIGTTNECLTQLDISSEDSATIQNSQTLLFSSTNLSDKLYSLKIGPDRKIYCARNDDSEYLGVINLPDSIGIAANYIHNGLYLNGQHPSWGLNNAMELNYYTVCPLSVEIESNDLICFGVCIGSANIIPSYGQPPYSYLWSNSATTQAITDLCAGTYYVTVTDALDSSITDSVIIIDGLNIPLNISQNADTLYATTVPNYQWYYNDTLIPGATEQTYIINQSGYYYVVATSGGCTFTSPTIETSCLCVGISELNSIVNIPILYQNIPNPFGEETTINYYLPQTAKAAKMVFYDNMGKMIKEVVISQKGNASFIVKSSELSSGVYSYSLVVDEKTTATKMMVKN